EFQHMINFVQHVLVRRGQSEEGWLDEGLSKYAEELAGRSYLPGDPATFTRYAIDPVYDAYQYLSATGSYPLEIPEDTGKIGWIGASWLFTRYLVDQFGDSLPHRLVSSALSGSANVAAQTGQPFATSLTNWALANWVSDLPGFTAPPQLRYTSWHFRTTYQSLHSQDPGDFLLPFPLAPRALCRPSCWCGRPWVRATRPRWCMTRSSRRSSCAQRWPPRSPSRPRRRSTSAGLHRSRSTSRPARSSVTTQMGRRRAWAG